MAKNVRPFWIYHGAGLTGTDYYWLETLKRVQTEMPKGWKLWEWEFVRPDHAWLSKRGWVCFQEDWLPAGYEKRVVVRRPLPEDIVYEASSCVDETCPC